VAIREFHSLLWATIKEVKNVSLLKILVNDLSLTSYGGDSGHSLACLREVCGTDREGCI
jgi:hypothetical protein